MTTSADAPHQAASLHRDVDFRALFAVLPTAFLLLDAGEDFVVVDANQAYLELLGWARDDLVGRPVFEAFPPPPDSLDEFGRNPVRLSFERTRDTGRPDPMPMQKYDVVDPATGETVERYWSLISAPVPGPDGTTRFVLQRVEDVTEYVLERQGRQVEVERGQVWQRRLQATEADLYTRAQELRVAQDARQLAGDRLSSLAEVALRLAAAETVQEMADVVFAGGLPVLGACGGAIGVRSPDGTTVRLTLTDTLGEDTRRTFAVVPLDSPMPSAVAARGEAVFVPDVEAAAAVPGLPEAMAMSGTRAWAALPLRLGPRLLGSLAVGWAEPRTFPLEEVELLAAFAAQCAQVLDRLQVREGERAAAAEVARISETLQRSLLTAPPHSDRLSIGVRYQPASQLAQVGGDWHDAFRTADGTTHLVIGDVAGHDRDAAAAMAQVRNILRGIAQTLTGSPAAVLAGLDRALHALEIDVLATAVLAHLAPAPELGPSAQRLTWCNAGHPPPLVLHGDGTAELLVRPPELLTGLTADAGRRDHSVPLMPGDALLLYTDGLVETRGGDIEVDLERLRRELEATGFGGDTQHLVDRLADAVDADDDVALLAVRVL